MRTISTTTAQPAAFTNTVLLLIFQVFAALFCSALVFMNPVRDPGCDNGCNYATANIALYGMASVSALTILVSITLTVGFRRQKRRTWPIPLIGLGVMLAAFFAAMLFIDEATG